MDPVEIVVVLAEIQIAIGGRFHMHDFSVDKMVLVVGLAHSFRSRRICNGMASVTFLLFANFSINGSKIKFCPTRFCIIAQLALLGSIMAQFVCGIRYGVGQHNDNWWSSDHICGLVCLLYWLIKYRFVGITLLFIKVHNLCQPPKRNLCLSLHLTLLQ